MAVNTTQGIVLAIFGANAGGHLSSLDANATANGSASLATDLSAAAGLILGVDLSTNAAFTSTVLSNLGIAEGTDGYTLASNYFTTNLAAGAGRGDLVADAVEYLLGSNVDASLADTATAFTTRVTNGVTYSQGEGASVFSVNALQTAAGSAATAGAGDSFDLSTAATDIVTGTSGSDTFNASTQNTLQTGDIVQDLSTTDNDVLNATSTQTTAAPRLTNIETINLDGPFIAVGMALTNVTGTQTLNVNSGLPTGTATITDANSLNAANIVAGDNIATLNVTSLASGTRDSVNVDAGSASSVTITGNATAADSYTVDLAEDATLTLATMNNTSVDAITVNAAGDFTLTSNVAIATDDLTVTINAEADTTVTMTAAAGNSASAIVLAGDDVVLDFADGDDIAGTTNADGVEISSTAATSKLVFTDITTTNFLNQAVVDTIEFDADLGGATQVTVNEDSNVLLSGDVTGTAAVTLAVDNADGDGNNGTLRVTVAETLTTAALTTDANVDALVLTAATDEATDTDANANGSEETELTMFGVTLDAATTTFAINGEDNLTITTVTGAADYTIAATSMTGELTIDDTAGAFDLTIALGSGNDEIKDTVDAQVATVFGNGGDDKITTGSGADVINGGDGDDELNGAAGADTIKGDAGADEIDGGAGADTITGGAGADVITMVSGEDGDTIKDLDTAEDTLILTGAGASIDLTDVTRTGSVYNPDDAGAFDVTLTGVTADDLTGAVVLGTSTAEYDITAKGNHAAAAATTIVAGAGADYIKAGVTADSGTDADDVAHSITLGDGADMVVLDPTLIVENAKNDTVTVTVTDFVVGTDQIRLEGAGGAAALDLTAVTPSSGVYNLGGAHFITLKNGGSNLTVTDLSNVVTLGAKSDVFTFDYAGALTLGNGADFVDLGATGNASSAINIEDNGGFDTITGYETAAGGNGTDTFSFTGMDNITGTGADVAANAAKIADAVSGQVYVFADSTDGTGSEAITTFTTNTADGVTAATILADVAAFLNGGITSAVGESYIAIINDGGNAGEAHAYYVNNINEATIASEDLTYIGAYTGETAGDILAAADIA